MQGEEEKTTREILFEVRRDVKWICLTLQEIKECQDDHENRLRGLESFRSEEIGNRTKGQQLTLGMGAGAGGLVAVIMRLFGGG